MRRVLIALASAALLGGVALTTVASAHEGGEDLHYLAEATSFEHTDLGDGGHQIVVNFDLFEHHHDGDTGTQQQQYTPQDHTGEESVGHGVATCVTANADEGVLCSGNIMVDEGQISSQGIVHVPSHHAANEGGGSHSVLLPITGGSGDFVGAAGEVEISHEGHDESASETSAASVIGLHVLGMSPADHGGDGHKGGHHVLHLTFHLQ